MLGVISLFCCVFLLVRSEGFAEVGNPESQKWGHITVREDAHMFWWLYYTTAEVSNYTQRPLIIWLQGGPGMSSCGYGNFLEIGPLDVNFKPKNYSLVQDFNLLFLDNPVGTGYSYVTNNDTSKLAKNNTEIGRDLVTFLKSFLSDQEEFRNVPLYIFGESYGGKMAVEFAYQIMKDKGKFCNLEGIGLGSSYISPIDFTQSYAPMALHLGLVDKQGYQRINKLAKDIKLLINKEDFENATFLEEKLTTAMMNEMPGVDFYNFNYLSSRHEQSLLKYESQFTEFMNDQVRRNLSIDAEIEWLFLNYNVYTNLEADLMRPVTKKVEFLLNKTGIKVLVYSGVLDILVNTAGTRKWLNNLKWKGSEKWKKTEQIPFEVEGIVDGLVQKVDNLVLYTIFRAGHSVPYDNMPAFRRMVSEEILHLNSSQYNTEL